MASQYHRSMMITGAPGSGKSTLANYYCCYRDVMRLPGHTTRPPRPGECAGRDYVFITHHEFLNNLCDALYCDPTLYVTRYLNEYYGSPCEWIYRTRHQDHTYLFTPTSTVTAALIKCHVPDALLWIHLDTIPEDRASRVKVRGVDEQELRYRLAQGDSHTIPTLADVVINTSRLPLSDTVQCIDRLMRP